MVKFSHTVFALPFALSGAALAALESGISWPRVVWIVVAMVGNLTSRSKKHALFIEAAARVDRALLDNFSLPQLRAAVALNAGRIELEASGNIDAGNLREIAETGVDYVSIGALTKHVQAIDFSLRYR